MGCCVDTAFSQAMEKTFYIALKVAHDEGLSDDRAVDAVLLALECGVKNLIFPVFAPGRDEEEHGIEVVDLEIF